MIAAALASELLIRGLRSGASPAMLWLPVYLDWFALGILLASLAVEPAAARWRRTVSEWARSPGTCWIVGALCFWLVTLPLGGPRDVEPGTTWEWTTNHLLCGAAAFLFLLPLTQGGSAWTESLLGNRTMKWLGEISYGIYLWHFGLMLTVARWWGWSAFSGHFFALFAITAVAATGVAAVSWHFVERPLLRRFSSSWRPVARDQTAIQDDAERHQAEQLHPSAAGQGMA
jgi:peptidoglycan/LPS O-acetylase OafA/YrhL